MNDKTITIKQKHDKRLWLGHHWIFSNELIEVPDYAAGDVVEVINSRGNSLGMAFFNPKTLISARLLFSQNEPDKDFFVSRITDALKLRERLFPGADTYRLIFGESDFLPGLIVDKYGSYLSIQVLSAGIELRKDLIIRSLLDVLPGINGIYEKSISSYREIEGLPKNQGLLYGTIPDRIITSEEGINLSVNLNESQKTGYYLDQRINRKFIRSISGELSVLDCYTNQGGFALNASAGGATNITAVDISKSALDIAAENIQLNGFSNITLVNDDVPAFLNQEIADDKKYDMVILDPPAFAKNRKKLPLAKAGYAKINRLALKLIPHGGFLVSSSCTQVLDDDSFYDLINFEASRQNRKLIQIFKGGQSPDHPIISAMPETNYLKFYVFRVI